MKEILLECGLLYFLRKNTDYGYLAHNLFDQWIERRLPIELQEQGQEVLFQIESICIGDFRAFGPLVDLCVGCDRIEPILVLGGIYREKCSYCQENKNRNKNHLSGMCSNVPDNFYKLGALIWETRRLKSLGK